jgi:hypothetical protein
MLGEKNRNEEKMRGSNRNGGLFYDDGDFCLG